MAWPSSPFAPPSRHLHRYCTGITTPSPPSLCCRFTLHFQGSIGRSTPSTTPLASPSPSRLPPSRPSPSSSLAGSVAQASLGGVASRCFRCLRTQLGAPNSRASGPLFLQRCTRPSRETPQRLPVVPLIPDKRYYGESPVGLRRYERAVGGRRSSHYIENSEEPFVQA